MKPSFVALAILLLLVLPLSQGGSQTIWKASNGRSLGKIEVFFSPSDSFVLGSTASGIYRSMDCGRSWTPTDLQQLAWFLIADSAGRLYAGTSTQGVYRSVNGGINWTSLNNGFTTLQIRGMTGCPNGNVVAITASGIFGLAPHDTTWTLLNEPIWRYDLQTLACNRKNYLFSSTSSGVTYRSTDGGISWAKLDLVDPHASTRTIFVDRDDNVYRTAGYETQRSTDNGETWTKVYGVNVVSFDQDSSGMLFAGSSTGVVHSTDGGLTWQRTATPFATTIVALDNGIVMTSGLNGEIYRSVDHGGKFTSLETTPNGTVEGIAIDGRGTVYACSFAYGVFKSHDNGASWIESDSGMTDDAVNCIIVGPEDMVFSSTQHGVFKSVDSGESWTECDTGITTKWTNDLCWSADGRLFAVTFGGGPFVSSDTGRTWRVCGDSAIAPAARSVISGANGAVYMAYYPGGLYRSTDMGAHWQLLSSAFGKNAYIRSVSADTNGHVVVETEDTLKVSDDNGVHWRPVSHAFGDRLSAVHLDQFGHLYQSTNVGKLYRSDDYGMTWIDFSSGLPDPGVALKPLAAGADGYLFAGTSRNGVYRTVATTVTTVHETPGFASAFALEQNYPNPFNPTTSIRFSVAPGAPRGGQVPAISHVKLAVYDILGKEVAVLVNEKKAAGTYEVQFNAASLASGVYFYRLQAGGFMDTKKLLLIR